MTDKMAVFAKLTAKPGGRDAMLSALELMFERVATEPGTEVYALHADLADDDVCWFYELYTDGDAATAHGSSDAMKRAMTDWGDLLAGRPEITLVAPTRAKGLDL
ncbi:hypothetical protein BH20ACT2_BH20ACT2_14790 [soil metagenome]